jgi:hypothetical protein
MAKPQTLFALHANDGSGANLTAICDSAGNIRLHSHGKHDIRSHWLSAADARRLAEVLFAHAAPPAG